MSNLELELWGMLGEALALANPCDEAGKVKLAELSNRYGFICDELEDEEEADLTLLEEAA
jgi:hypothetical protein